MRWSERITTWTDAVDRQARTVSSTQFDTLLAMVFGAFALVSVYGQTVGPEMSSPNTLGAVAAVAGSAPIAFRRRSPILALAVSLAVTAAYYWAGFPEGTLPLNCLLLTYSVAAWTPPARAALGLAFSGAVVLGLGLAGRPDYETANTVVLFVGVWLGGSAVRWRRESVGAELLAAQERAEIDRQRAARLVAEERLRIAQELHDVVAHSMSVIAVQAGVGSHLLDERPAQAREALDAISTTSRETLDEMRRLLGTLRDQDGERVRTPAPAIADLPALVDDVCRVGVPAELRVSGTSAARLNPTLELSAYRIIQEALTNVIKHAGTTTRVAIDLERRPTEIFIRIDDDGRGAAASPADPVGGGGHGLVGMRERAELWRGTLECGPRPGGGYRVTATLPYGSDS